jgi:hypothetical protein
MMFQKWEVGDLVEVANDLGCVGWIIRLTKVKGHVIEGRTHNGILINSSLFFASVPCEEDVKVFEEREKICKEGVGDYSWVTDEMFDAELSEFIFEKCRNEGSADFLMFVGDVWSELKEEFNNEILERLEERCGG